MSAGEKPRVFLAGYHLSEGLLRLQQRCDVTVYDSGTGAVLPKDDFHKLIVGMAALYIEPLQIIIDKEALDIAGPQLKVIGTFSVGLEHIDLEECKRRGIKVGYTPNVLSNAVAEATLGLTLLTARRFKQGISNVLSGQWKDTPTNSSWRIGKQVSGSVVGIVGLGRIGLATAKRFKAFEPSRIVYCGRTVKPYAAEIDAEFVSFQNLLQVSDFVIVVCSVNDSNRRLFDAQAFEDMKSSAIFINMSRGAVVDHDALYDALLTNQISAAGLDVTDPEPMPKDHKLLSLPNCVVLPHMGSSTVETRHAMCHLTVDNIFAGLDGDPLPAPAY